MVNSTPTCLGSGGQICRTSGDDYDFDRLGNGGNLGSAHVGHLLGLGSAFD